ncbi:quinoprotein relay system zinc metallohydrolase 2 [Ancylobacter sp. MQZ15Z-1]|uniref:Quinoprotein relay system zinc metallohydrolase 2 n=1 Tax=Ancylobacter mangrovi TaxID=2972472 RepID=A0A9X2T2U8_9HYPH|nr:quinoprotein relay system zinc metallohydrolase 2 [Ancylobacter mangrovi]MCS0496252.1 quinoprotein relay system zinc metallohydrolase 2 [Ancylobacter mangrovi]
MPDVPRPDRRSFLALAAALVAGGGRARAASDPPASGPSGGAAPMPLEKVADGIFVFRAPYEIIAPSNGGAIANMTLIVGAEAAAVVDTGNSRLAGERMLAAVRATTDRPLRYVVNTHMHPDHTLGNAAFEAQGVRFVAHHKMPRALSVRADTYLAQVDRMLGEQGRGTRIVLPDLLVDDTLTLDLGGRVLDLAARPTAHTDNDLTIRDRNTGTWLLGDLLFVGHVPTLDGSLLGWLDLLGTLAGESAPRVVPGHGPASVEWPAASEAERRYLAALRDDVRRLIADGRPMGDAPAATAQGERGAWSLFDEFNARNAIAAYHELEWE